MGTDLYLGIDFGTSGARAIAIDDQGQLHAQANHPFLDPATDRAGQWQTALWHLIAQLPQAIREQVQAIAINGTSSTVLLCDPSGTPLTAPLLYNDARGGAVLDQIAAIAPAHHPVISATSTLAKLVWWLNAGLGQQPCFLMHQADWLACLLHGQLGVTDYHNALKLGYDVGALGYPDWMMTLPATVQLPRVVAPGTPIAPVLPAIAAQWGLPSCCQVCAGTTDSIAAFLASGAHQSGEAVTSLGSTLVLKLLSDTRVDDAQYGIYSHRLGDRWLVGGASNTGGAVLRQFFSDADLQRLSAQISPATPSPYAYYPLTQPGERFPIHDPTLQPCLEPRPERDVDFLHGLLDSMARIEAEGYHLLQTLGATTLTRVYTAGGGAHNPVWMQMRSRRLGVPVVPSAHTEAAYGSAMLARRGVSARESCS